MTARINEDQAFKIQVPGVKESKGVTAVDFDQALEEFLAVCEDVMAQDAIYNRTSWVTPLRGQELEITLTRVQDGEQETRSLTIPAKHRPVGAGT